MLQQSKAPEYISSVSVTEKRKKVFQSDQLFSLKTPWGTVILLLIYDCSGVWDLETSTSATWREVWELLCKVLLFMQSFRNVH